MFIFRQEVPSRKQQVNINCCNEIIKTLYSAGYTQQLIVRKFLLAHLWFKVAQNDKIFVRGTILYMQVFCVQCVCSCGSTFLQGIIQRGNLGLEAFNFTDGIVDIQWVLIYTMSSCSRHAYLTSFYMTSHSLTTTMTDCELNCQLASQFSTNRVDEDLF